MSSGAACCADHDAAKQLNWFYTGMRIRLPNVASTSRTRNLGLLLFFIILLQFGYPITLHGRVLTSMYMLLYVGMILFGILTVREEGHRLTVIGPLAGVFVVFGAWFTFAQEHRDATLGMLLSLAAFMLALMVSLMRFIFRRARAAGTDLILAAVSVYLIIGGFFGAVFAAVEILDPGSFHDPTMPAESPAWQQLVYYSYVTMATLGYGEILPVTPWARSLATFETVIGALFLAVVISRLVGIWAGIRRVQSGPEG